MAWNLTVNPNIGYAAPVRPPSTTGGHAIGAGLNIIANGLRNRNAASGGGGGGLSVKEQQQQVNDQAMATKLNHLKQLQNQGQRVEPQINTLRRNAISAGLQDNFNELYPKYFGGEIADAGMTPEQMAIQEITKSPEFGNATIYYGNLGYDPDEAYQMALKDSIQLNSHKVTLMNDRASIHSKIGAQHEILDAFQKDFVNVISQAMGPQGTVISRGDWEYMNAVFNEMEMQWSKYSKGAESFTSDGSDPLKGVNNRMQLMKKWVGDMKENSTSDHHAEIVNKHIQEILLPIGEANVSEDPERTIEAITKINGLIKSSNNSANLLAGIANILNTASGGKSDAAADLMGGKDFGELNPKIKTLMQTAQHITTKRSLFKDYRITPQELHQDMMAKTTVSAKNLDAILKEYEPTHLDREDYEGLEKHDLANKELLKMFNDKVTLATPEGQEDYTNMALSMAATYRSGERFSLQAVQGIDINAMNDALNVIGATNPREEAIIKRAMREGMQRQAKHADDYMKMWEETNSMGYKYDPEREQFYIPLDSDMGRQVTRAEARAQGGVGYEPRWETKGDRVYDLNDESEMPGQDAYLDAMEMKEVAIANHDFFATDLKDPNEIKGAAELEKELKGETQPSAEAQAKEAAEKSLQQEEVYGDNALDWLERETAEAARNVKERGERKVAEIQARRENRQESTVAKQYPTTMGLMDKYEGGGDYDTLFGHAQKAGKAMAGVKVSEMTIDQLLDFSKTGGEYDKYSRKARGANYKATPMGRYQIVGDTLKNAAEQMGLSGDTVFTKEIQDQMFKHLAMARLGKASTMAGKRKQLRMEWEGFKKIADADLDVMINELEGGGTETAGVGSPMGGIVFSKENGPLLRGSRGASSMAQADAFDRLDEVIKGPLVEAQRIFGKKIVVNDTVAKAGSSREKNTPGSRHFHGDALDISTRGMSNEDKLALFRALKQAGFTGFGFGSSIIHADMGKKRAWNYKNKTFAGVNVNELIKEAKA